MSEFNLINKTNRSIGLITRSAKIGVEQEIVKKYVSFLFEKSRKFKEKSYTIFIEPKLESGYPDIVILEYRKRKLSQNNTENIDLSVKDLKILFECMRLKNVPILDLSMQLGLNEKIVRRSLEKLIKLDLIKVSSSSKIYIQNKSLSNPILRIIAIEAKIEKWNEALDQAKRNFWFASESYIMLNKSRCSLNMISECERFGVGIILVNGKIETLLKSKNLSFPVSYGSLLFWDWKNKLVK